MTDIVLGQTFDEMLDFPEVVGDSIRLLVHGLGTWLGFHVGINEHGLLSAVGYGIGTLNGIGASCDLISILRSL